MAIDDLDKRIISVLRENSRLSLREIAKKVGVSAVTILNRMNRLEKSAVIKGYSVICDNESLGYHFQVMVLLNPARGKSQFLENSLRDKSHITAIYQITGEYRFLIQAKFTSKSDLDTFLAELGDDENIEKIRSEFILRCERQEL